MDYVNVSCNPREQGHSIHVQFLTDFMSYDDLHIKSFQLAVEDLSAA